MSTEDLVVEATRAGFAASIRRSGTAVGPAPTLALTTAGGAEGVHTEVSGAEVGRTESAVSRVVAAAPRVGAAPVPFDTTVQTTVLRSDSSGHPDLRVGTYDGVAVARSFLSWDLTEVTGAPVAAATLRVHQDWVVVVPSGRLGGVVVGGVAFPRRSVRRRAGPPSRPSNGCGRRAPRRAGTPPPAPRA
ncbi:MAG: hypothetical protein L0H64_18805, partial [Pseudonocardia sp.]|nr:hypothetical protein [Pseudonocardia sp.]